MQVSTGWEGKGREIEAASTDGRTDGVFALLWNVLGSRSRAMARGPSAFRPVSMPLFHLLACRPPPPKGP